MPAKAKLPVIGWKAQTAWMARSRWICLLVPGAAADDQRRHDLDGALDACGIGGAGAFAPADEPILGRHLDQDIGHAAAVDERTRLDALIGNANGNGFELDDLHGDSCGSQT